MHTKFSSQKSYTRIMKWEPNKPLIRRPVLRLSRTEGGGAPLCGCATRVGVARCREKKKHQHRFVYEQHWKPPQLEKLSRTASLRPEPTVCIFKKKMPTVWRRIKAGFNRSFIEIPWQQFLRGWNSRPIKFSQHNYIFFILDIVPWNWILKLA